MLLTFPAERLVSLPRASGGGELVCVNGFGGTPGRGLGSGLSGRGDGVPGAASWTDIIAEGGLLVWCVSLSALTNQRPGFEGI